MKNCLTLSLFLLLSCNPKQLTQNLFTVNAVLSGNSIQLLNGYTVTLIGVDDAPSSRDFLEKELLKSRVKFVFDSYSPAYQISNRAKDKSFYAYIISEKGYCVNSKLLKQGIAQFAYSPYLNDSLITYASYAKMSRDEDEKPVPLPDNEDDKPDVVPSDDEDRFNESKYFAKGAQGELEKLVIACDYMNPITRDFAVKNAGQSSGEYNINQVIRIYDAIRPPNWHYVNDPKNQEYYSKASNTISRTNLSGDCDDFAILMYSMIMAVGGEARITFGWNAYAGHAFAEVNVATFDLEEVENAIRQRFKGYHIGPLQYRTDAHGTWLNLDWWAAYPGGKYMDYTKQHIFYPAGNKYQS